jgi:two-component system chemotaxis response regulator CheB
MTEPLKPLSPARPYTRKRVDAIVLGASAGGIDALLCCWRTCPRAGASR